MTHLKTVLLYLLAIVALWQSYAIHKLRCDVAWHDKQWQIDHVALDVLVEDLETSDRELTDRYEQLAASHNELINAHNVLKQSTHDLVKSAFAGR